MVHKIFKFLNNFHCFDCFSSSNENSSCKTFVFPWTGLDSFLGRCIYIRFALTSAPSWFVAEIYPMFLYFRFFTWSICSIPFAYLFGSNKKKSRNSITNPFTGLDSVLTLFLNLRYLPISVALLKKLHLKILYLNSSNCCTVLMVLLICSQVMKKLIVDIRNSLDWTCITLNNLILIYSHVFYRFSGLPKNFHSTFLTLSLFSCSTSSIPFASFLGRNQKVSRNSVLSLCFWLSLFPFNLTSVQNTVTSDFVYFVEKTSPNNFVS